MLKLDCPHLLIEIFLGLYDLLDQHFFGGLDLGQKLLLRALNFDVKTLSDEIYFLTVAFPDILHLGFLGQINGRQFLVDPLSLG